MLMLNPTYVGLTSMTAMDSLLIGGFTAFGPKYLGSQFAVTSSLAGILFGKRLHSLVFLEALNSFAELMANIKIVQ